VTFFQKIKVGQLTYVALRGASPQEAVTPNERTETYKFGWTDHSNDRETTANFASTCCAGVRKSVVVGGSGLCEHLSNIQLTLEFLTSLKPTNRVVSVHFCRVTSKGHVETWKDGSEHISIFHTFYNMLADAYVQWYIESKAIS
jgi:hypothetical protein